MASELSGVLGRSLELVSGIVPAGIFGGHSVGEGEAKGLRPQFVDPVDAVVSLAILALHDLNGNPGIKLRIADNRVVRDHARIPGMQATVRFACGASSLNQLGDVQIAVFYAVKRFPPTDVRFTTLFRLANKGIESLIRTYSAEGKHLAAQALHTGCRRMITLGLAGTDIAPSDFLVPDWTGRPLPEESKKLWEADGYRCIVRINNVLKGLLVDGRLSLAPGAPVGATLAVVRETHETVMRALMRFRDGLLSSGAEGVSRRDRPALESAAAGSDRLLRGDSCSPTYLAPADDAGGTGSAGEKPGAADRKSGLLSAGSKLASVHEEPAEHDGADGTGRNDGADESPEAEGSASQERTSSSRAVREAPEKDDESSGKDV